jgi:hypothetical protein
MGKHKYGAALGFGKFARTNALGFGQMIVHEEHKDGLSSSKLACMGGGVVIRDGVYSGEAGSLSGLD